MPLYSAAASFSGINTAGKVWAALGAGAARKVRLARFVIAMPVVCTNVPAFQLRRFTAAGTTPVATTAPQPFDPGDAAAGASLFTGGFSADPTLSGVALDIATLPLSAGAAWVWNFPVPIEITLGVANGVALYNANASGATLGTFLASAILDE